MKKRYIVVGSSAAAIGALAKLRALDKESEIFCVTAEKQMPYNRCLLADHLAGERSEENIRTRTKAFFDANDITLCLDSSVEEIDTNKQKIRIHHGSTLEYDKLFLGIGKSAFVPPVYGAQVQGVFPFFDLDDVQAMLSFIKENNVKKALVVGAGLTGLECADALHDLGISVSVVEMAEHALFHQIDKEGAYFIHGLMKQRNIDLYTQTSVQEILSQQNTVCGAELSNGRRLDVDMIIFATGGRPNSFLAKQAGITVEHGGIITNNFMQTSNQNVFAGGDVCQVKNLVTGEQIQSCLWPDATMQGMVAAQNMTGNKRVYPGAFIVTSSTIFDMTFVTCGPVKQGSEFKSLTKHDNSFYHRLFLQDGVLKGFVMVGNILNLGELRQAIMKKTNILEAKKEQTATL